MTIDEAIKYVREAEKNPNVYAELLEKALYQHKQCAEEEHNKLADWRKEIKQLKG